MCEGNEVGMQVCDLHLFVGVELAVEVYRVRVECAEGGVGRVSGVVEGLAAGFDGGGGGRGGHGVQPAEVCFVIDLAEEYGVFVVRFH